MDVKWDEIEIGGVAKVELGPLHESEGRVFGSFGGAVDCEIQLAPDAHARLVDAIRGAERAAERGRRRTQRRLRMARAVARARRAR